MNEPSRTRRAVADVGRFEPGAEIEVIWGSPGRGSGHRVYVPAPDEQAIERGDAERRQALSEGDSHAEAFRRGLAAALEQPE